MDLNPGAEPDIVLNMRGELIALGPMRRDLVPLYHRWSNDPLTQSLIGGPPLPRTLEDRYAWFERFDRATDSWFTMYELASMRPIGSAGLKDVDRYHRSAEFGILIGEAWARGKGYGTEAALLLLDMAFTGFGLHSVYLTTGAYNIAGQRSYAKAGFKELGRRRECDMFGGKLYDLVYMDCLAAEFTSPLLGRLLAPERKREA